MKTEFPTSARMLQSDRRSRRRAQGKLFVSFLLAASLSTSVIAQGHGGHGGGHGGGGYARGGHVGGTHVGINPGRGASPGMAQRGGFSSPARAPVVSPRTTFSQPNASRVVTVPSRVNTTPSHGTVAVRSPVLGHSPATAHFTAPRSGQHFDAARWMGGHAGSLAHSPSVFATGGGHSSSSPTVTHLASAAHSTWSGGRHQFDAAHWMSGHGGGLHHFSSLHHDGHHGLFDHHDFHPLFFGLGFGLGWGWGSYWSYPYYRYPSYGYAATYYDYGPYPAASYGTPVYPDTNAPPASATGPTNGVAAPARETRGAAEERFADVFFPRMELPSREAPEALPEEKTSERPQDVPSPERPPDNSTP